MGAATLPEILGGPADIKEVLSHIIIVIYYIIWYIHVFKEY